MKFHLIELRTEQAPAGFLQILKHWMGTAAVDVDLGEDRERDVISQRAEVLDFLGVTGFLAGELIARKSEDLEPARMIVAIELLQP